MMDELFPNAEQRAERRVQLHALLDTFLDNHIAAEEGGWPVVMRDDLVALEEVFGEIIDLKFERDCDGDRAVVPLLDDRTKGRMTFAHIPDGPERDTFDGDAVVKWYSAMSGAIHTLTLAASSATHILTVRLQEDAQKRQRQKLAEDWIKGAREHLAHGEVAEAENLMKAIIGEGKPHPVAGKLGIPPRVLLPKDDPRVEELRFDIYTRMDISEPREAVKLAIDAMENAELSDRGVEQRCFTLLRENYEKFSRTAFRDEIDRANRVADARSVARKKR
jgi:hypothetical protein